MAKFLTNCWYMCGWAQDLEKDKIKAAKVIGKSIALIRCSDGSVSALEDMCPHRFAPLSIGKCLPGDRIQCAYHGLEFDSTGKCVHNPHGNEKIPKAARVRKYPAVEKHSMIWVWLGDGTEDYDLIPDLSMFDTDSGLLTSKRDFLDMNANYRLISNNLLDLSHASYLHDGLLGNADTIKADLSCRQVDDTLYVDRWTNNVRAPALFDQFVKQKGERVDAWTNIRWDAPAILLNDVGFVYPGEQNRDDTYRILAAHLLTPIDEDTTRYHFAAAIKVPLDHDPSKNEEIAKHLSEIRKFAFEKQDAVVIEAQHKRMNEYEVDTLAPVMLEIDVGLVRCDKIMKKLMDKESAIQN